MKLKSIILLLSMIIVFFSCKKENDVNYKVTEAVSLFQNTKSLDKVASGTTGNYVKDCPGGYAGCGATAGIPCLPPQEPCKPPTQPILRLYPCPGSNTMGCKSGIQSGFTCTSQQSCPGENHPIPCNFGSIAFGCFPGSPAGGPSCGTLVNCQTPPD
ncbi:hypothetical protein [Pedobacter alluvionis]|uniref:Lipoprotein n=1 Tax=Pedobacter alluvionis TaxID=475253 RepID=A0A497XRU5_9SPHI|nr:hypothetical protein [Pedobacter alluvionis]RLJ71915.1 hypothetical protein BCL90_4736 [Pedobacter alluvionis]TFB28697.1 hypothetical protein E3V97_21480 [Pedobacter alluvionis]